MISRTPADLIRSEVRALSAYHVPPAQGLIKLDAMENPYGWPEALKDLWLAALRDAPLNRYPDPHATALKARLRHSIGIPEQAGLILGNGSDELIQIIILAVASPERVVLAPEPSFAMYRLISRFAGLGYHGVPLRAEDFSLDLVALLDAVERERPAVIFLAYPNNPTGNCFPKAEVRRIIEAAPGLVVVDEAYFPFAGQSFLETLADYEHLLVMRTLSKLGLAGLRLGLLVGAPRWLEELDKLRLPYNINVLTQLSAEFALTHQAVLDEQAGVIRAERARLFDALSALPGIRAFASDANFILFRAPSGQGAGLFQALHRAGILIKNLHDGGLLQDCLRVTVGTPEENRAFLTALRTALEDLERGA